MSINGEGVSCDASKLETKRGRHHSADRTRRRREGKILGRLAFIAALYPDGAVA